MLTLEVVSQRSGQTATKIKKKRTVSVVLMVIVAVTLPVATPAKKEEERR